MSSKQPPSSLSSMTSSLRKYVTITVQFNWGVGDENQNHIKKQQVLLGAPHNREDFEVTCLEGTLELRATTSQALILVDTHLMSECKGIQRRHGGHVDSGGSLHLSCLATDLVQCPLLSYRRNPGVCYESGTSTTPTPPLAKRGNWQRPPV